jgi:two-component system, NtrC family, response regulator AtoC
MSLGKMESNLRLLLIDDEEVIHKSVGRFLENMGYQVLHALNGREGLEIFFEQGADILISDIKMPDMDGMELLDRLNERAADVEVILITGHGDLTTAIQAMRKGAFDFFSKPVEMEELIASLERTQRYRTLRREKDRIQQQLEALLCSDVGQLRDRDIIGESQVVLDLMELVDRVAHTERTTVLLQGESGTGKELVARAVHRKSSRAQAPFISINCTAIPDNLFESELFGHEKGAFTDARSTRKGMFELGNGGVVFLDEIGDMDMAAQAKLLRVLEERCIRRVGGAREIPVDIRLIAATNQHLQQLVTEGRFREDLFFRLNVFAIALPPLRDRGDDVLLLAYHFLQQFADEIRKEITRIEPEAQEILKMYPFPGNVRELRNIIERAVILCDSSRLTAREFADLIRTRDETGEVEEGEGRFDLAELEERAIRSAMAKTDNNQTDAARLLGIGHDALRYRLKKYGMS